MTIASASASSIVAGAAALNRETAGMLRRTRASRSAERSQTILTRLSGWVAKFLTRFGPQWPTPRQLTVITALPFPYDYRPSVVHVGSVEVGPASLAGPIQGDMRYPSSTADTKD